jgi:aminoglycoside phosphotransferase (APT) family kinase protein
MRAEELERRLAARLEGRVEGLTRLSGGASQETWAFDLVSGDGRQPLILRREARKPLGPVVPEGRLLAAARAGGVPVPSVVVDGTDDAALDGPYLVLERIDGETIPRKILRDDAFSAARPRLAGECGRILARLHAIPVDAVPGLAENDQVAQYRELLDAFAQPHPAFELAFRWLEDHRPPAAGRAVVHGDFRNGNLIVGPDGVRAVLDWELAHVGDPMEDLGWLCVKAWRFGSDLPVGGFGDYPALFDAYASESGVRVDRAAVRWWEVMGTLKWGVMCIAQAFTHLSGAVRSVELATIGRRVCENEWDLLQMLDGAA